MENLNFDIQECSIEMYAEFIDEIDKAFNYNSGWFLKHLGHVLPNPVDVAQEDSTKNLIAVHDGKIIGASGFYPMNIIISDGEMEASFKLGGVGQVSCLKEYRGHGVMSALLNAGISRMRDTGIELSWLGGLRSRYGNFGYELGGCEVGYQILSRDIKKLERPEEGKNYTATKADIDTLDTLYRLIPSRVQRDEKLWNRHICRENLSWVIRQLDGKTGYICYDAIDDGGICEVAGDGNCVLDLFAWYMRENNKDFVHIKYPNCNDNLSMSLYKASNFFKLAPNGQFMVVDQAGVYEKLLPFVKNQCQSRVNADFLIDKLTNPEPSLMESITSKMIGFTYGPPVKDFEFLSPLAVFMPQPDMV